MIFDFIISFIPVEEIPLCFYVRKADIFVEYEIVRHSHQSDGKNGKKKMWSNLLKIAKRRRFVRNGGLRQETPLAKLTTATEERLD